MPEYQPVYHDRRRAESFGTAAQLYDRYRPRYPRPLIDLLVTRPGIRVLDVGAGTGIASAQLAAAGAEIVAVEPDIRMANICNSKGFTVECSTFEDWDPAGRTFDVVVFGQSFHWVQPEPALATVRSALADDGRLVLMWNRVCATVPRQQDLDRIYAGYLTETQSTPFDSEVEAAVTKTVADQGFSVERVDVTERLHYTTDDWLSMVFTYSNHLTLEPAVRDELRQKLCRRIGDDGVGAINSALALVCTPVARG